MSKSPFKWLTATFGDQSGEGKVFHASQTCPECGSKLFHAAAGDDWQCPNPDCPAQIRRGLVHWCSPEAMDIAGAGQALVAQLVECGLVRDVAELYLLKTPEVAPLKGMEEKSAKVFVDAITASKKRDAWRVLYGLGIPRVGLDVAKSLARQFSSLDLILDASTDELWKAGQVNEVIVSNILQWWGDPVNRKLVHRLRKAGVNFNSSLFPTSAGDPVITTPVVP